MNSFILEKKLPTLWKEPPLGGRGLAFHRPCQQRKRKAKGEMLENVGPVRAALSTTFSSGPFSASATDDTARVGLGGGRTKERKKTDNPRDERKRKERSKTDTPNEGWDEDKVPTCTSRILEERSGGQVGLSMRVQREISLGSFFPMKDEASISSSN